MAELEGFAALRVLIVEDHPVDSLHLSRLLEELGCWNVQAVSDAHSALQRLQEDRFDVVFSDISMEEGDGAILAVDLVRMHDADASAIPALIWVSSLPEDLLVSHERLAQDAGIASVQVLRKPVSADACQAALRRAAHSMSVLAQHNEALMFAPVTVSDVDVATALAGAQELRLVLQPQVDLQSRQVVAAEALIRWNHPEQGEIPAPLFIPAIERLGLDLTLFHSVLARVLQLQNGLIVQGIAVPISVNASASTLSSPDFARDLARRVEQAGVPAALIRIELTEEVPIADLLALSGCLNQLRVRGFELAIDDFGIGIATMKLLTQLPFSELKIDREFVRRIHDEPVSRVITSAALGMGETLGLRVIAEGIEDERDIALLLEMGARIGQGYGLYRPMEVDDFVALLCDGPKPVDTASHVA